MKNTGLILVCILFCFSCSSPEYGDYLRFTIHNGPLAHSYDVSFDNATNIVASYSNFNGTANLQQGTATSEYEIMQFMITTSPNSSVMSFEPDSFNSQNHESFIVYYTSLAPSQQTDPTYVSHSGTLQLELLEKEPNGNVLNIIGSFDGMFCDYSSGSTLYHITGEFANTDNF